MRHFLLLLALAPTGVYASCPMDALEGTYVVSEVNHLSVVSCLTGQINASLTDAPGSSVVFERATCMPDGTWVGSSCDGTSYFVTRPIPYFNCPDVVLTTTTTTTTTTTVPTTTTTVTTTTATLPTTTTGLPKPKICQCSYVDAGAALNLVAPLSFCKDGHHTLQCDDKIFVKNGNNLDTYEEVSCTDGQWFGTGCDGTQTSLNSVAVSVQCGVQEPPFCPQLPTRDGLKYVGMESGFQRYTCEGSKMARLTADGDRTTYAKYVECNSTSWRVRSSNLDGNTYYSTRKVTDFACRDYGSLNQDCSVPIFLNAFLQDGVIRCEKGFFTQYAAYYDSSNTLVILTASSAMPLPSGTSLTGVQLSSFLCGFPTPANTLNSTCANLNIVYRSVQFSQSDNQYKCMNTDYEQLKVVSALGTTYGSNLQCLNGDWILTTASSNVTVPVGSEVSCVPIQRGAIPDGPFPLIYTGLTFDGLARWACIDSVVTLDLDYYPELGLRMTSHGPFLDVNNTQYRIGSSVGARSYEFNSNIRDISCTDMGSKHAVCSDPYDVAGIRIGNRYECMKGYSLKWIAWINGQGVEGNTTTDVSDTQSMECQSNGWKIQGTSLSGLRVYGLYCEEVSAFSGGPSPCVALPVLFEKYSLKYDFYRKYFTCYNGETLGYTLNSVKTLGMAKKLYCGTNSSGAPEWKWSYLDGTQVTPIPSGAKMNCF